jgi:hypothetical protein
MAVKFSSRKNKRLRWFHVVQSGIYVNGCRGRYPQLPRNFLFYCTQSMDNNYRAVRETNDDAATCKYSCVNLGYYSDDYLKYFVKEYVRRPPLINRGYWARVSAYQKVMHTLIGALPSASTFQVVNLGAGFDTSFWNIKVFAL